ncbi:MAG: UbiA family prenyltransferase [Acidimicrobiia bacterium]|nr:UbiA family prenyltransferase [Acidimicrobiia bacterium]
MQIESSDRVWRRGDVARLIRLFSMGATAVYVPLGMATSGARPTWWVVAVAVVLGVSFHLFAFPLNDVVDLPIDRTNARRATDPLVRGLVPAGTMLVVAVVQLPVMAALLVLGAAPGPAIAAWLAAVAGLGIYDLWGKRTPVPVVSDVIQGVGFAALVVAGALWAAEPTPVTWLGAAYVVVYIVQINAVHGGLRDLENDLAHGARTTPILLGCRADAAGAVRISPAMLVLALATEFAMIGMLIGVVVVSDSAGLAATAIVGLIAKLVGSYFGWRAYRAVADRPRMMGLAVWNLFWTLIAIVISPLGGTSFGLAALTTLVFVLPPWYFGRLTS